MMDQVRDAGGSIVGVAWKGEIDGFEMHSEGSFTFFRHLSVPP